MQKKFRSQLHLTNPKPFSPRWISGYGLMKPKRSKKFVGKPITKEMKFPAKRSFGNRTSTHSSIHLDHKIHSQSRPKTAPDNTYRVWDSTAPVKHRYHKRQFLKTQKSNDRSTGPFRTGKRTIRRVKPIYPDVPRFSNLRMFPGKKQHTFDKPNASIPQKTKRIITKSSTMHDYIAPSKQPQIPNLSAFPRRNLKDVWRVHTPLNTDNARPKTSAPRHRSFVGNILMHL
eukprot:971280_1